MVDRVRPLYCLQLLLLYCGVGIPRREGRELRGYIEVP